MPFGHWCRRSEVWTRRTAFLFYLKYKWEGCGLRCFRDPAPQSFRDSPTHGTWNTRLYPTAFGHPVCWARCERMSYCSHSGSGRPLEGHRRPPGLGEGPTPQQRQALIRKTRSHVPKYKTGAFCPLNQEQNIVGILGKREMYLASQRETKQLFKLRSISPIQLLKQNSTRINIYII